MKLRVCGVHCYMFFLVLEELWSGTCGIRWLALATVAETGHIASQEKCDLLMGLNKRQKRVCRRNVDLMDYVRSGAKLAIDECQSQFHDRRWNCSMVDPVSVFGNVLSQGTREAAFVHAISAAGVSHAVTQGCSTGLMSGCGCDRTVKGNSDEGFEWSGCSHNVAYGNAFSERFVDARERTKGSGAIRALMNLHNNKAGRKAIEDNMTVQCKCHGVSGSCEMKTCWKAMPQFNDVGRTLKDKFDGATEVVQKRSTGTRKQLQPTNPLYKHHSDDDLVYLQASPDFCEADQKTGSLGTHGRLCSKSSKAIDGCELLCCGRGFHTRRREVIERCMCKFHWCCYVKCQKCVKEVEEHFCR